MIKILPRSQSNVLGVLLSKKITHQDYLVTLIPALDRILEEYKTARLLAEFSEDFSSYAFNAFFEDVRYTFKHSKEFKKFAVVNAPLWLRVTLPLLSALTSCQCRSFERHEREEAWTWIET